MKRHELTAARLRELYHFDPDTGKFTRLVSTSNGAPVGPIETGTHDGGYLRLMVDGVRYKAHRLAWLYVTGEWPKHGIDHKNGDKSHNVFANLRDVPQSINNENQRRARADSKTGLLGVTAVKDKWNARIRVSGTLRHLGTYTSASAAHTAYLLAKSKLHAGSTLALATLPEQVPA